MIGQPPTDFDFRVFVTIESGMDEETTCQELCEAFRGMCKTIRDKRWLHASDEAILSTIAGKYGFVLSTKGKDTT